MATCDGGGLFPQFRGAWKATLDHAISFSDSVVVSKGRRRVAIKTKDPKSFCALLFAFANDGTDLFFFNPSWSRAEWQRAVETAAPHWILGDAKEGTFEVEEGFESGRSDGSAGRGLRVMIPTGGTSGRIRFAVHDSASLAASAKAFMSFFGLKKVSSHCVLPLYHVSGFMQIVRAVASEGEVVFGSVSEFEKSHAALSPEFRQCHFLSLVPTQLRRLLAAGTNHIERLKDYRAILVGGGPLTEDLAARGRSLELPLAPTYGMTETASMVATLKPEAFLAGKYGQGFPLPHAELSIVPDASCSNSGQIKGRIEVKASSLFTGYYGQARREGDAFLTGDWGQLSPEGELTVLGRLDRVIISGGEKVYLEEVERATRETGLVSEGFAFGLKDGDWGNALCLAYCPRDPGIGASELKAVLSKSLAPYKLPKFWLPLDAVPRNESGKILVEALRERIENRH